MRLILLVCLFTSSAYATDIRVDAGSETYLGSQCQVENVNNILCATVGHSPISTYTTGTSGYTLLLYSADGNITYRFENCVGDNDYAQCSAPDEIFRNGFNNS
jgi:hypothetical protein